MEYDRPARVATWITVACCLVTLLCCFFPWYNGQYREPGGPWTEEVTYRESDLGDPDSASRANFVIFVLPALIAALIAMKLYPIGSGIARVIALVLLAYILYPLVVINGVGSASLGIGEWSSTILGGYWNVGVYRDGYEHRVVWTWWAGIGWWATVLATVAYAGSLLWSAGSEIRWRLRGSRGNSKRSEPSPG